MDDEADQIRGEHDAGDPAQAFEALRASVETMARELAGEMTVIRKGVETAFDEFEKFQQPPDYGRDLGAIVQQLAHVGERLQAVEQSPILRHGAEHYAARLERGGRDLMEKAQQALSRQAGDLERMTGNLARHVVGARERQQQDRWLWGAGAAGLVAGVLLTLFLPRVLPGSVDMAVAATIMSADRWTAGGTLMQSGSPGGWRNLVEAGNLVRENKAALRDCAEAAAKAKKDQKCTITVAAPAQ